MGLLRRNTWKHVNFGKQHDKCVVRTGRRKAKELSLAPKFLELPHFEVLTCVVQFLLCNRTSSTNSNFFFTKNLRKNLWLLKVTSPISLLVKSLCSGWCSMKSDINKTIHILVTTTLPKFSGSLLGSNLVAWVLGSWAFHSVVLWESQIPSSQSLSSSS